MNERPSWTPSVSVVGIGETGKENIQQIQTTTSAQILPDPSPTEILKDTDFLFISADITETNVQDQIYTLLDKTDPRVTVLFAEGLSSTPENLMGEVNLLIPVDLNRSQRVLPHIHYGSIRVHTSPHS